MNSGRQTCEFSSVASIDKAESSNPGVLTVDKTEALGQYGVITLLARDALAALQTHSGAKI